MKRKSPDQLDIALPPPSKPFDGSDYDDARDRLRLHGQILRVFNLMKDGRWRTLKAIAAATGDPETSVSAQLRHLRKDRFGGFTVDKAHLGDGLYQYKMLVGSGQ